MQNFSGYIFGTVWWGIALNLIAYFVASHVSFTFFRCNNILLFYMHVKVIVLFFWRSIGLEGTILVEQIQDLVNQKALAPFFSLAREYKKIENIDVI